MINELSKKAHKNALSKGFKYSEERIPIMVALIHSEASELLECDRKDLYSDRTPIALENMMKEEDSMFIKMLGRKFVSARVEWQ